MKPVKHHELSSDVLSQLRDECLSGRWEKRLPGTRVLANELGVSAPTVARALQILAEEKLVERPGPRRAFEISDFCRKKVRKLQEPGQSPARRALIITPKPSETLVDSTRLFLRALRAKLDAEGFDSEECVIDFFNATRPRPQWDKIRPVREGDCIIAIYGRDPIAHWAQRHGLRTLFIGGETKEPGIPIIGVDTQDIVADALKRLINLGHRDIVIPLNERAAGHNESIRNHVRKALAGLGVHFQPDYHTPVSAYTGPDIIEGMLNKITAIRMPSAFIVPDWRELIALQSQLSARGFRIPRDISLVLLNGHQDTSWLYPEPSFYKFPVDLMAAHCVRWCAGAEARSGLMTFKAEFHVGKSVTLPPDFQPEN